MSVRAACSTSEQRFVVSTGSMRIQLRLCLCASSEVFLHPRRWGGNNSRVDRELLLAPATARALLATFPCPVKAPGVFGEDS